MSTASDAAVVPLAERLRAMQWFRAGVVAVALLAGWIVPEALGAGLDVLLVPILCYAAACLGGGLVWQRTRGRGLRLFGALLMGDGVFLAWLIVTTGATTSPLLPLVLLHLVVVALLASYRTSMKLALWHSLLLVATYDLQAAGLLSATEPSGLRGTQLQRTVLFIAVFWLVAVATATFSSVNERELRRRRFDLEALAVMAAQLEEVGTPDQVAGVVLRAVADALDAQRALLLVTTPDGGLHVAAAAGVEAASVAVPAQARDAVLAVAVDRRQTLLVEYLDEDADAWLAAQLPEARNLIVLPLTAEGLTLGVIVGEHCARSGSRIERRLVATAQRFASHGALALRNARLLEEVRRLADTDALTGLANRRTFSTTLDREIARAQRSGEPVGLVMLDVDHFKRLNDTHGHQAGDAVLTAIGLALRTTCRGVDLPARYGGEEFAVILPGAGREGAAIAAARLHAAVAAADVGIRVTASVGVATLPADADTARELVAAADRALYAAKASGRNQVAEAVPA